MGNSSYQKLMDELDHQKRIEKYREKYPKKEFEKKPRALRRFEYYSNMGNEKEDKNNS